MRLGIFAKTFTRNHYAEVIEAVKQYGFDSLQFNMSCAGLPSMPDVIPEGLPESIHQSLQEKHLGMSALSGTYNMIHPDHSKRRQGLASLGVLIRHAKSMGTSNITLCTGSKDPYDMWKAHPENNSSQSWLDLCNSLENALSLAELNQVHLLIETELSNVINSTLKAKKLLDELQNCLLKIVFDPANLYEIATADEIQDMISEGIELLGDRIEIVHAKDRLENGGFAPAGKGNLPYPFLINKLKEISFNGDLILHGLSESEVSQARHFLQQSIFEAS